MEGESGKKKTTTKKRKVKVPAGGGHVDEMNVDEKPPPMKVWMCTDHETPHPFAPASIVVAPDVETARAILTEHVRSELGRNQESPLTLVPVPLDAQAAYTLNYGGTM